MVSCKKPKAILFDLDDTITSYDSVCNPAWEKCCKDFILRHQPEFTYDELLGSINHTRDWYWSDPGRHKSGRGNLRESRREVVRYSLEALGIKEYDMAVELADNYSDTQSSLIALLPGSKEALEMVQAMGIRMAVVTNGASAVQREKLARFGITGFFEEFLLIRKWVSVNRTEKYFNML